LHAAELIDVSKWYPVRGGLDRLFRNPFHKETLRALFGVGFFADRGEVVALLGPNGSGKSTALKILASLILPTTGIARIEGDDTAKKSLITRSNIGYCMAEERSFYFRLSGRQNLRFFGKLRGIDPDRIDSDIEDLTSLLGLGEIDKRFMTYSTGTRQKLSVARALMGDKPVLLLDEPTRGLDPYTTSLLLDRLRRMASEGRAVVLASHDLDAVDRITDRLVFLHKGEVLACGSPAEVLSQFQIPAEIELEVEGAEPGWTAKLEGLAGVEKVEETRLGGDVSRCKLILGEESMPASDILDILGGNFRSLRRFHLERGSLAELYKRFSSEDSE